jgi:hypothetical protein
MASSLTRGNVLKGPAIILYNSASFYTEGDIQVTTTLELQPVNVSAFGKVDDTVMDIKIEVTATPVGVWAGGGASAVDFLANAAILWPWLSSTPGTPIFPATQAGEKTLVIWTITDGAKYTYQSAAITKMPSINASTQKIICGPCTWTCIRELAASTNIIQAWTTADSLMVASSAAFTDATFATTDILRDSYTAAWGSVTGFTAIETLNGFSIDFGMDITPESCDGLGVYDYTLKGLTATCKFQPLAGPTPANLITAMKISTTGGARGMSLGGIQGADLVISGSVTPRPKFTLYKAQLTSAPMGFGMDQKRIGELTFEATRTFASSATGAIAAIGHVAA